MEGKRIRIFTSKDDFAFSEDIIRELLLKIEYYEKTPSEKTREIDYFTHMALMFNEDRNRFFQMLVDLPEGAISQLTSIIIKTIFYFPNKREILIDGLNVYLPGLIDILKSKGIDITTLSLPKHLANEARLNAN